MSLSRTLTVWANTFFLISHTEGERQWGARPLGIPEVMALTRGRTRRLTCPARFGRFTMAERVKGAQPPSNPAPTAGWVAPPLVSSRMVGGEAAGSGPPRRTPPLPLRSVTGGGAFLVGLVCGWLCYNAPP